MRHMHLANFAVGVVAALIVGIAVTEVALRWIFFPLLVGTPAVTIGVPATAVTTRS